MEVLTYRSLPSSYRDYDPDAAAVAGELIDAIRRQDDRLRVEHIGSSAVPGCGGKGYIDLLVTYPPGSLDAATRALQKLGFQRQQGRDPFPEDRPMRVGLVRHQERDFLVHVHVISGESTEGDELTRFRDRLKADDELRRAYEAEKRRILDAGVTDPTDYAEAKTEFIRRALAQP